MKKYFFLAIASFAILAAKAQFKPRNQVGVSIGWQNFRFLDKQMSPLTYGTNSLFPSLGLFYSKESSNSLLNVEVSAINGSINPSRFGQRTYLTKWNTTDSFQYRSGSKFIHANVEASYMRKLSGSSSDKFNYWIGGTLSESGYYSDAVANADWLLNVLDLAPAFQFNYTPFNKHVFGIRTDLSIIGVVTRPVYSLFAKSNKHRNVPSYFRQGTQVATVDKFKRFNFQFNYSYRVAHHFTAGVEYRLRWLHYTLPKEIRAVDKSFDIKLSYTY